MRVFFVSQVLESDSFTLGLIQAQRRPLFVFTDPQDIQDRGSENDYTVTIEALVQQVAIFDPVDSPDNQASPKLRIMLRLRLASNQLGPDNIANTVSNKDRRSVEALLCMSSHIRRAKGNDNPDNRAKESQNRVPCHRCNRLDAPCRLPNHSKPCYNGETTKDEGNDTDIIVL